jgi:hypothetical protein
LLSKSPNGVSNRILDENGELEDFAPPRSFCVRDDGALLDQGK